MSYKSMIVCLDSSAGSARRLEFALALAASHGAHLTGMHLAGLPLNYVPPLPYPDGQMGSATQDLERDAADKRQRAAEVFRHAAQRAGVNCDWVAFRPGELRRAIARARTADLAIVGQRDPDDGEIVIGEGFPEIFVLGIGRPALFVPYTGPLPQSFGNVLIAWDGGREAARAVADAIPLLAAARRVLVITAERRNGDGQKLPDLDIATFLSRHGVKTEIEKNGGVEIDPGQWLLSRAADFGADLLVMGAYGHSRLSELVLGGVTRTMLRQMTLPVLMSH